MRTPVHIERPQYEQRTVLKGTPLINDSRLFNTTSHFILKPQGAFTRFMIRFIPWWPFGRYVRIVVIHEQRISERLKFKYPQNGSNSEDT